MNHYMVEFENGFTREFKALSNEGAGPRALSMLKRLNQPLGTVYRVNPFGKQKKLICSLENEDFNSEVPTLNRDPEYVPAAVPNKKSKKKKGSKKSSAPSERKLSVSFKVPLSDIADKLKMEPTALRRKLRKSEIQKPTGNWGWDSWDHPDVVEILSWKK